VISCVLSGNGNDKMCTWRRQHFGGSSSSAIHTFMIRRALQFYFVEKSLETTQFSHDQYSILGFCMLLVVGDSCVRFSSPNLFMLNRCLAKKFA
jgi:hypothetical protein